MKKRLLLVWRIIVAAGMVCILFAGGLVTYEYMKYHQRQKQEDTYLSGYSGSYFIEKNRDKGTVRLKSAETGKYITPVFDRMFEGTVRDTLTVFFQNKRRGYLNVYTGKIVIPAQFDKAWIFSEGLGAVVKNNKVGFVNRQGELVIPYRYSFRQHWTERVDFLFKGGTCAVIDTTGKHGLIDKTGKWVVAPDYDYINNPVNGLRIVKKDEKYGVLDDSLHWRLLIEYDWIKLTKEGFIVRKNTEQKLLAVDGKTVLQPLVYDSVGELIYRSDQVDNEGDRIWLKSKCLYYMIGAKYGLMDKTGKPLTDAIFNNVDAIDSDLFRCEISGTTKLVVNAKGEIVR